jgi:hypothetical protein
MNMTPKGPRQKMLKLAQQGALSKPWGRRRQGAHMHKGASQQLTEKHRGARRGKTGPKRAWAGWPRPVVLTCFGPGSRPPLT